MSINTQVAQNIKHIREQKKLTLDAAANLTGVSRSMLAQIEKGSANPTISVLWKIANGYKISITKLIEESRKQAMVFPSDNMPVLSEDDGKFLDYSAFPFDPRRSFETHRIVIAPGGNLEAEPDLIGTEASITIFSGTVRICVRDEEYCLSRGDSIRFIADQKHSYTNIGDTDCVLSRLLYYLNDRKSS